jgi:nicotinamidase-related amidase
MVKSATKFKTPIIAFKDTHIENDLEFEFYPPHCIKGTNECELIPELKPFEDKFTVIEKNTTNGFITKSFQNIVKNVLFDEVIVVGCCTDICVEQFATDYQKFNEENNRKTKIIVIENATYTFDAKSHNAKNCHDGALKRMANAGITILQVGDKLDEKTY